MDIDIKISFGDDTIQNLAFIRALLIKKYIENLNINYDQKQHIKKEVLKELERLETR